jgi:DNA-binding transcriptional LysR family regulator
MDFRHIEAFIKVVELASFSKAAEELHISQPSVSSYVNLLEKELGAVLINRAGKVLSTTAAGERFLGYAKKIMGLKHETIESLRNLSGEKSGEIRILASTVPALYILPEILAKFRKVYPKINFSIGQGDTSYVADGIAAHKADIGFAGSIVNNKKCDFIPFMDEGLVFISCYGLFCKDKEYSLEEILYENCFISRELGSGTRMQYEDFFLANGVDLDKINICAEIDNTYSTISAAAAGLGVSIVSEIAAKQMIEQNAVMAIKLKNPLPQRKIYIALNKNMAYSHLVKIFLEYVLSASELGIRNVGFDRP